jgi:hypothetical protein
LFPSFKKAKDEVANKQQEKQNISHHWEMVVKKIEFITHFKQTFLISN